MTPSFVRQSILTKVTLIVLFTSTMTLGIVGVWEYKVTRERMENALSEQAKMLSERLALAFVKIVWDYDQKLAESVILSEMKEKSISGILVWEEGETEVLFGGWRSKSGKIILTDGPLSDDGFMETDRVILRHAVPIGKVRVYLTDRYLNDALRAAMWTILIRVLLLNVVMILMLIILIRSFLIRPLSSIRYAMKGIQEGELEQNVDVHSADELGQIAESFNGMAEQLHKREQQLVESEEKFSALVSQAADALFLHDMNGAFLDVNQSSINSLGYTRDELLSMRVSDVDVNYSNRQTHQQFTKNLRPGIPLTLESEHKRKDGTTFPVEIRLGLIQIKGQHVVLALARDISERKISEIALKKAHDELEIKVAERTLELSVAKDQAEAANMAKSDFLARMSHEIRTPLNAVTGLANILLKTELTDKQRDYLNKVQIASNNLMSVINDILDFSKVEAGRLVLANRPLNLDQLLEQLADLFSNRLAQKDLELLFDVTPNVPRQFMGDSGRLTQVLTNLIENAVKFTASGEIVLRVTLDHSMEPLEEQCTLKFLISDTGIGISADVLPTLFDPFTQADSSLTREHEGTGLGLAICQRLVQLMGGRIWAESMEGKGSTFIFTAVLELQKKKTRRFVASKTFEGIKVLVVDDSATGRQAMEALLGSYSFTVASVDSGQGAIDELQQAAADKKPYQLVLLDWKMPGMDGIETAHHIRALEIKTKNALVSSEQSINHAPTANTRRSTHTIIMVTAYGKNLMQERINRAAVDHILFKPVQPSQLFNVLMALFGRTEANAADVGTKKKHTAQLRLDGRRVIVVEDSFLNIEVASALLEETGLTVETAVNGKIAVEKVTRSQNGFYDAVLMDVQMPVMDGYEATKRIRTWELEVKGSSFKGDGSRRGIVKQTQSGNRMPIIALTAHALAGERNKCLDAGMDDYIAKPIDEQDLHRVLLKWISPLQEDVEAR